MPYAGCQEWLISPGLHAYTNGRILVSMRWPKKDGRPAGQTERKVELSVPPSQQRSIDFNQARLFSGPAGCVILSDFAHCPTPVAPAHKLPPWAQHGDWPLRFEIVWHCHMQSKVQEFSSRFSGKLMPIILSQFVRWAPLLAPHCIIATGWIKPPCRSYLGLVNNPNKSRVGAPMLPSFWGSGRFLAGPPYSQDGRIPRPLRWNVKGLRPAPHACK